MLHQPWNRLENEPANWYDRFTTYLLLGPQRTVNAAWLHHASDKAPSGKRTTPGSWTRASARYAWRDRARQWDDQDLSTEPQLRMMRSNAARRRRLQQIQRLLDDTFAYFENLKLPELSPENALKLLPTLRPLLVDLLSAYQKESEAIPPTPELDKRAVTYWSIETFMAWKEASWIEFKNEQARIYQRLLVDLSARFDLPDEIRDYRPPVPTIHEFMEY